MNGPIVAKVGGSTLGSHDTALADVAALRASGRAVVVVHGGGDAATGWLKLHGIESEFVDGLRVTGPAAIDVVMAVFAGLVNKQIVGELRALGAPAFGLAGMDGGLIESRQLDPRLGYVGEITAVDRRPLDTLLAAGYLPVVASLGFWPAEGRTMNINADTVAGEIAAALGASDLVFLTDVANVRDADGAALKEISIEKATALIDSGTAAGGMIPKLRAGARATAAGVRCQIVDGREPHALGAVLEGIDLGTLVRA